MSLFGFKQVFARQHLVALLVLAICILPVQVRATPITDTPERTNGLLSPIEPLTRAPLDRLPSALEFLRAPDISNFETTLSPEKQIPAPLLGGTAPTNLLSGTTPPSVDVQPRSEKRGSDNESLRQALRSLLTTEAPDIAVPAPPTLDPSPIDAAVGRKPNNPRKRGDRSILDSRAAGRILREFVDVQSESDRSVIFSVMGMGNFVLQKSPRSGAVTLSELSSGWSGTLLPGSDPYDNVVSARSGDSPIAALENDGNLLLFVWDWLVHFVSSPIGIVLSMIASIIALLAVVVRIGAFFRDQTTHRRRNRRRRRRRSSRPRAAIR